MKRIVFILSILMLCCNCYNNSKHITLDSIEKQRIQDSITHVAQIKLDSIKKMQHIKDSIDRADYVRSLIKITKFSISRPNSAGGVDVYFRCTNLCEKSIKYIRFELIFENNVNDLVFCDIRDSHYPRCELVGPINKLQSDGGCWENIIYNYSTRHAFISELNIIYMDGSEEKLSLTDLKSIKNTKV